MLSSICRVSTLRGGDEMLVMSYSLIGDFIRYSLVVVVLNISPNVILYQVQPMVLILW